MTAFIACASRKLFSFLDEITSSLKAAAPQTKAVMNHRTPKHAQTAGYRRRTQHHVHDIIAATNQDLAAMVADGRFRQDLFYRLNGFTIHLPALRERREDIASLLNHFIKVCNRELGKTVRTVTPEAQAILEAHDWPGNIREFQSAIKFAMVQASGDVLTPDDLPETCRTKPIGDESASTVSHADGTDLPLNPSSLDIVELTRRLLTDGKSDLYRQIITAVDRAVLEETMRHFDGNQLQAAERLGISRMTLRTKLRTLGLLEEKPENGSV